MGLKTKGGFWCGHCEREIVAQKGTSRLRNTVAILSIPATGGASAAATSCNNWHCPACGGPVTRARGKGVVTTPVPGQADRPADLSIEERMRNAAAINRRNEVRQ